MRQIPTTSKVIFLNFYKVLNIDTHFQVDPHLAVHRVALHVLPRVETRPHHLRARARARAMAWYGCMRIGHATLLCTRLLVPNEGLSAKLRGRTRVTLSFDYFTLLRLGKGTHFMGSCS